MIRGTAAKQGGRLMRSSPDVVPTKDNRMPVVRRVFGNAFLPETAGTLNAYMEDGTLSTRPGASRRAI